MKNFQQWIVTEQPLMATMQAQTQQPIQQPAQQPAQEPAQQPAQELDKTEMINTQNMSQGGLMALAKYIRSIPNYRQLLVLIGKSQ